MTARTQALAKLTITPTMGPSGDRTRVRLVRSSAGFRVDSTVYEGPEKRASRTGITAAAAEAQLTRLGNARIPAIPLSDRVLDGELVELLIVGPCADLSLSYWTVAPAGYDDVEAFVEWLRSFANERS